MEIFIDSASINEIEKWLEMGVVDGVTTNPSIMLKDGVYDAEAGAKEIAAMVHPRPLSVEVTTNDLDEMLAQGAQRWLAGDLNDPDRLIERIYWTALGRRPVDAEQSVLREIVSPVPNQETVHDLLWAICVHPDFQLIP